MNNVIYPGWLNRELRSDHAGETGAVWIYRGILSVSTNNKVRTFARNHLATELKHLKKIESLLAREHRSRLLPLWRISGFFTGAIPTLCGSNMTFRTIEAVETFVVNHYQNQINEIQTILVYNPNLQIVHSILTECQSDEARHRDEAAQASENAPERIIRLWSLLISAGSRLAVSLARRF